jgi:nucleoid-associated protein YgaU
LKLQIVQAAVKVAAVLGIAVFAVVLMGTTLYVFQRIDFTDDQDTAIARAGNETPYHAVEPDTLASSERISEPATSPVETEDSTSVPVLPDSLPESPASKPQPSVSTRSPETLSPLRIERDSASEAEADPALAEASAPKPEQLAPLPASQSSEAASDTGASFQVAAAPAATRYHTVTEGDTLHSIARQTYGAGRYWTAIYEANRNLIKDPVKLKLGWTLELPPPEAVESGD